jgi:hypothetical protein
LDPAISKTKCWEKVEKTKTKDHSLANRNCKLNGSEFMTREKRGKIKDNKKRGGKEKKRMSKKEMKKLKGK